MKLKTVIKSPKQNVRITVEYDGGKARLLASEQRTQSVEVVTGICKFLLDGTVPYTPQIGFTDIKCGSK